MAKRKHLHPIGGEKVARKLAELERLNMSSD
jgi:hypothetical protein